MYHIENDYEYSGSESSDYETSEPEYDRYNINKISHKEDLVFVSKSQTNPIQSKPAPWINFKSQINPLSINNLIPDQPKIKSDRIKLHKIYKKNIEKININSLNIPNEVKSLEKIKIQEDVYSPLLLQEEYDNIKNQIINIQQEGDGNEEQQNEEEEDIIIEYNSSKKHITIQDSEIIRQKQIEDDIKEKEKKEKRLRKNAMRIEKKELEKQELLKKMKSRELENSTSKKSLKKVYNKQDNTCANTKTPTDITNKPLLSKTPTDITNKSLLTKTPTDITNKSLLTKTPTDITNKPLLTKTPTDITNNTTMDNSKPDFQYNKCKGIKKLSLLKNDIPSKLKSFLCYSYFNHNNCSNMECIYAHNIDEFLPKNCHYGINCKKIRYCNFCHPNETKQDLINKITSKKKYGIRLLN
jgi:hypothetical protein